MDLTSLKGEIAESFWNDHNENRKGIKYFIGKPEYYFILSSLNLHPNPSILPGILKATHFLTQRAWVIWCSICNL